MVLEELYEDLVNGVVKLNLTLPRIDKLFNGNLTVGNSDPVKNSLHQFTHSMVKLDRLLGAVLAKGSVCYFLPRDKDVEIFPGNFVTNFASPGEDYVIVNERLLNPFIEFAKIAKDEFGVTITVTKSYTIMPTTKSRIGRLRTKGFALGYVVDKMTLEFYDYLGAMSNEKKLKFSILPLKGVVYAFLSKYPKYYTRWK